MLNWLKNKIEQPTINRYKKGMEEFLILLQATEETQLENIAQLSVCVAEYYMENFKRDLYAPFSDENQFVLATTLFEEHEQSIDQGIAAAYYIWGCTFIGAFYPELLTLSKQMWLELRRAGEIHCPEGFEPED